MLSADNNYGVVDSYLAMLKFLGEQHAYIFSNSPAMENIGSLY